MYNTQEEKDNNEVEKIGFKDILAIMIAQFQILIPIGIGAVLIMWLLMLFVTKVWMKV